MKLFFCYEQTSTKPSPAMYHGKPPAKSINGGGPKVVGSIHDLTDEEAEKFLADQSFSTWLLEKYPAPVEATA